MKNIIFFIFLLLCCFVNAQKKTNSFEIDFSKRYVPVDARQAIIDGNYNKAVEMYTNILNQAKNKRTSYKGVDGNIVAEYAYALALSGNIEYAITNIDRAIALDAKNAFFFTYQILKIAGFDTLAFFFLPVKGPDWLSNNHTDLAIQKINNNRVIIRRSDIEQAYKQAMSRQYIHALTTAYLIEREYPAEYTPYIVEYLAWKGLGKKEPSITALEQAVSLMDSTIQPEEKNQYIQQLSSLKKGEIITQDNPKKRTKTIIYTGFSWMNGSFSWNGRVGLYNNNNFSTSFNFMKVSADEQSSINYGISIYKTWAIVVGGFGLSMVHNRSDTDSKWSANMSLSTGLSIPNDDRSSSYDFMLNIFLPITNESTINYSITLGRTLYF
ncbi:MAG: hypothetical protein K6D59_04830 [Bacteroidales bacterium]|nr:hypothetical protein [Bacteroidales bacterium]